MRAKLIFTILLPALLLGAGCHKSPDACAVAVEHYEREDLSDDQIVQSFQQLADHRDPRGKMWLARLYLKGRCSLLEDKTRAQQMADEVIDDIRKRAEKGDPESEFLLGAAYQEGLGVGKDQREAVQWLREAADAGHPTALNNLANMLAHGYGADADIEEARRLFARAAADGSVLAKKNLSTYSDDGRDDTQRLADLRAVPLFSVLGMDEAKGIQYLAGLGLISDPNAHEDGSQYDWTKRHFKKDGILLSTDMNGRITAVEAHAKGFNGSEQFRGELPLKITWDDTANSARQKLGSPDDSGDVASDGAYGMAYRTENVFFSVMFSYDDEKKLKVFRVYEKWTVKY